MKGRHTATWPKIWIFSPVSFIFFVLAATTWVPLPKVAGFLVKAGGVVMVIELISKLFKMGVLMLHRKFSRASLSFIYGKGIHGTPTRWNRKHWPGVFLFLTLCSFNSNADYTVTDSMRYDREWRNGSIGTSKEDVIEAMCRECSLSMALSILVPKDFTVYIDERIEGAKKHKINFIAGRPWGLILQEIASQNDLSIEIMKHKKRLIVDPSPKKKGSVSIVSLEPRSEGFYQNKSFELIPGDKLKETLERWAASEGWTVVYALEKDFTIENHARFNGNLIEVVRNLMEAYKADGTLSRVNMFYSHANNTIKIALDKRAK